jgi:hypothetical protein
MLRGTLIVVVAALAAGCTRPRVEAVPAPARAIAHAQHEPQHEVHSD